MSTIFALECADYVFADNSELDDYDKMMLIDSKRVKKYLIEKVEFRELEILPEDLV